MSDPVENPARPVSLFTTVFILALLAAFLWFVRYYYSPATQAPQQATAENLPKDQAWRADSAARRATLAEVREAHAQQAGSYRWVDQKAGLVQLPIERAMELTAEQYAKKPAAPAKK